MENQQSYYITKLNEVLATKQRANEAYSLRAFARDLGLDPSSLSKMLKGTRAPTLKDSRVIVNKLKLSAQEQTLFLESVFKSKAQIDNIKLPQIDDRFMLDGSQHKVIAEWEHFVVETLFELDDFDPTIDEIARSLNTTPERASEVLDNLLSCGLLVIDKNGKLKKVHSKIRTPEDVMSKALRESHLETLEMGKNKLDEVEVELRDFSSMTLAMDLEKVPEAKIIIREFRQKMMALLKTGNKTEVFQLAIQLYPVTKRGI